MGVQTSRIGDALTTITIEGGFNFNCYTQFNEALSGQATKGYVVDLTLADYMDSSALGMLLLLRDKVGHDRERVRIVTGVGQPREVLRLANFAQLFRVAEH